MPGENPSDTSALLLPEEAKDPGGASEGDADVESGLPELEGLLLTTCCCNTKCEACGSLDCNQV